MQVGQKLIFILKYFRCRDGELGWRVSVLPIPAFHVTLHVPSTQWNAGMGNTDALHPNSCFYCFSIPTSKIVWNKITLKGTKRDNALGKTPQ